MATTVYEREISTGAIELLLSHEHYSQLDTATYAGYLAVKISSSVYATGLRYKENCKQDVINIKMIR